MFKVMKLDRKSKIMSKTIKMWIDGQCYDIKINHKNIGKRINTNDSDLPDDTQQNPDYEIVKFDNGRLYTSFKLPSSYFSKLRIEYNRELQQLEDATNTTISPENSNLIISGECQANITEARNQIHSFLGAMREQNQAFQFISIPAVNKEVVENFERFKGEILAGEEIDGMHESIFMSSKKLHLTIIVLSLMDEIETQEAIHVLNDYATAVLKPLLTKTGPLKIEFRGIGCMQPNLRKANVLYAKPRIINEDQETNLQQIANSISHYFNERGLVLRYQPDVKLHMTLINTKYRRNGLKTKNKWATRKQTFDATSIMNKYQDFYFGECGLNKINLSLISSVGDDGFYKSLSTITL